MGENQPHLLRIFLRAGLRSLSIHNEIDPAKRFDTLRHRRVQAVHASDIHAPDADYFGPLPSRGDVFGHRLCLLGVAADDECVGAEVHQGTHLGAADGAGAAGAEDDFVGWASVSTGTESY